MNGRQDISTLLAIMARLRAPDGCPWDREQDFGSIAPHTIEEAYEVADAIDRKDMDGLKDELGDLLFQTVYHAQLAAETGAFTFAQVVDSICSKMIRRHPHVFGDAQIADAEAQTLAWEQYKAQERAAQPGGDTRKGILDGVPMNLPALIRAHKLQARASKAGFDWRQTAPVIGKLREEIGELEAEIAAGATEDTFEEELGDVLFSAVNLARHLRLDPEAALRRANRKFERRFAHIEQQLAKAGKKPAECTLAELDALWEDAKQREAAAKSAI